MKCLAYSAWLILGLCTVLSLRDLPEATGIELQKLSVKLSRKPSLDKITSQSQLGRGTATYSPHLYNFFKEEARNEAQQVTSFFEPVVHIAKHFWGYLSSKGYSEFFRLAEEIKETTKNKYVEKLAKETNNWIPDPLSAMFRSVKKNIRAKAPELVVLAMRALEEDLPLKERRWVLSFIEKLTIQDPETMSRHIQTLGNHNPIGIRRGELEFSLMKGNLPDEKVWNWGGQDHPKDVYIAVEEVFQRVNWIHRLETLKTPNEKLAEKLENLHDKLLTLHFPLETDQVTIFIQDLERLMVELGVSSAEKDIAHELYFHLDKYDQQFQRRLSLLMNYDEFRKEFYSIRAKENLQKIIESPEIHEDLKNLIFPFHNLEKITSGKAKKAIDSWTSDSLVEEKKVVILEVINAASSFNDVVWGTLMGHLKNRGEDSQVFVRLWDQMTEKLTGEWTSHLRFESHVLRRERSLMLSFARDSFFIKLKELRNGELTVAEELIRDLPLKEESNHLGKTFEALDEMIAQMKNSDGNEAGQSALNFESISHLMWNSDGALAKKFVEILTTDKEFADNVERGAQDILKENGKLSGILESAVKKNAENFHLFIMNQCKEAEKLEKELSAVAVVALA